MQIVSIKSNSADTIIPLLKNALEREKKILSESYRKTREKVELLAFNHKIDLEQLKAGKIKRDEVNEMNLIELEGLCEPGWPG